MNNWYEVTIKADKLNEDGKQKKVSEKYLFDALSFTEAESRAYDVIKDYYSDFKVARINPIKVSELFFSKGEFWYKCKVNYITLNEKAGKETKTPCWIYVQADTPKDAESKLSEGMKGTMADWALESIVETKIIDVYKYDLQKEADKLD